MQTKIIPVLGMLALGLLAACTVIGVTILCCSLYANNALLKTPLKNQNDVAATPTFNALRTQPLYKTKNQIPDATLDV